MKHSFLCQLLLLVLVFFSFSAVRAQSPGLIVQPRNGNGVTFLNPNGDKYTSATASGFTTNDETQSEIPFKIVPPVIAEPVGDQNGGPNGGATDFVPNPVNGNGFYAFYDGTNMIFRFRVGGMPNGSKGYSVLLDTDLRIGNSGFYADTNYVAKSSSRSGNPGFELEVVLEYGKRVVIYNVDGTTNGTVIAQYPFASASQVSIARSSTSGDADYFIDFGVPVAALGIGTQYIRMVATTGVAAQSALSNNASDVFGINDIPHKDLIPDWEAIINSQCGFPVSALSLNGSGICVCTPRPSVNSPIYAGTNVTVSGVWNRLDPIKSSQATITLFQNGNIVGTTTATTGVTWSITLPSVSSGDVFYAKAQAAPENMCLQSDPVTVTCGSATAAPVVTCGSQKGISGTIPLNSTVQLYQVVVNNGVTSYTPVPTGAIVYTNNTNNRTFDYFSDGKTAGNPCSPGAGPLNSGSYVAISNFNGCLSAPAPFCLSGSNLVSSGTNAITLTTPIYNKQIAVTGSGTSSGSILTLYKNNQMVSSITAGGGKLFVSKFVVEHR